MDRESVIIDDDIIIPARHLRWSYAKSSGSGGMHRDHNLTKARLHWDMHSDDSVSQGVKERIRQRFGGHVNVHGQLVLAHGKRRSQSRNRQIVLGRLRDIVQACLQPVSQRLRRGPTKEDDQQRIGDKKHRQRVKRDRRSVDIHAW
jgi:ribosome-associated protein